MKTTIEISLNEKAIAKLEAIINRWRAEPGDDASLRKCYTADRKDLRKVLSLYKKGRWKEACEHADHLDTLVREMIPEGIWNHIHYEYEL